MFKYANCFSIPVNLLEIMIKKKKTEIRLCYENLFKRDCLWLIVLRYVIKFIFSMIEKLKKISVEASSLADSDPSLVSVDFKAKSYSLFYF